METGERDSILGNIERMYRGFTLIRLEDKTLPGFGLETHEDV